MIASKLHFSSWKVPVLLLILVSTSKGRKSRNEVNLDDFLEGLEIKERGELSVENNTDWRSGKSVVDQNEFLLANDLMTDCTVLVGPDKESIKAHRLFLARSSPILAAYLSNSTQTIYVEDVGVENFRALLRYMYRGSFCAASAEEACALLRHAKRYQMLALEEKIRTYLWVNMYPDKVWYTFRCAADNNDQFLTQAALYVISWRTEELIADPFFLELPHSALTQIMQLRTLNLTTQYAAPVSASGALPPVEVSAEMKLFDALLHWAVAEAERKGIDSANPEAIRGVLGPIFKNLRAIMLNFDEFIAGSSYSDPSYNEALDVLYNTNAVYQPSALHSPSLKSRKPDNLEVRGSLDYLSCNRSFQTNMYDILTSASVPKGFGGRRLLGVQVPARQLNLGDLCIVNEDFTVEVLDHRNVLLGEQRITLANTNVCMKSAPKHVNIQFSKSVSMPSSGARVRVVYHSPPGRFPSSCAGFSLTNPTYFDGSLHEFIKLPDSFICSFVFEKK